MGIKTVKYKSDSIIYFKGDAPDRVYLLKNGSLVTSSTDLKTNEDILTIIKVGEFIGVKNVISGQPYSETVTATRDSELVVFYKDDFENFILSNNRVMMQTLAVFSNQLRKIHLDIKELTHLQDNSSSKSNTEKDLYELGVFFIKSGKNNYGNYCLKKYIEVYPQGLYINEAREYLSSGALSDSEEIKKKNEDHSLDLDEAKNYLQEGNFRKAHELLQGLIDNSSGSNKEELIYLNGASLFKIEEYKKCIMNFSTFMTNYKTSSKINEVMFYVGVSYKKLGDIKQSTVFLQQVVKRGGTSPLAQEAMKVLKE